MHFSGLDTLIRQGIIQSVEKATENHLTRWSSQEESLMVSGLLSWVTVIENPAGHRDEDLTYKL